jgi:thiol:disulfide interchange protein DsbA
MLKAYIKKTFYCAALLFISLLCNAAEKALFIEGQDYIKLSEKVRSNADVEQLLMSDPRKVQVLFFFSYGCHGCEMFHTPFEKWATVQKSKPNSKLAVYIYPVSFNAQWQSLAKMYYVMQTLDPSGKLNNLIFDAIHKKAQKLWLVESMKKFFMQNGYTAQQFDNAYNSFSVTRAVKRAADLTKAYSVAVTPDIVVNGPVNSYKVELSKVGNNTDRLFQVLDYLVAREAKLLAQR